MKRGAKILLIDKDKKILILRRSLSHPIWPHHLDLPGGIIEKGETPKQAIIREVLEETKLKIDINQLKLIFKKRLSNNM
jgi:8-oxo-dGTP pyrophosphatase MutT (NUDIX family)